MRRVLVLPTLGVLAALSAAPAARAERAALHDIAYYMSHPAVRSATLSLCRSDHSYDHDPDCHNAESAELNLWADRAAGRTRAGAPTSPGRVPTPRELLTSPSYWIENRLARIGALAACRLPNSFYTPDTCAAVRQAEAADPARGGRR